MVMKRSDAILSLSEKLQKSQNLLDGYKKGSINLKCLCDNLATRIMNYCENEIGMYPPDKFHQGHHISEWEPEDE
jgi:hypothetical protein